MAGRERRIERDSSHKVVFYRGLRLKGQTAVKHRQQLIVGGCSCSICVVGHTNIQIDNKGGNH